MPTRLTREEHEQAEHVFGLYRAGAPDAGLSPSIKKWQRRLGVAADGIPGPNTLAALARLAPEAEEEKPDTPEPVGYSGHALNSAPTLSLSETGRGHRLSPHFTLGEFASKDGADEVKVHPALLALLENIRAHFGRPLTINSGYRSPAHNRAVGGASQSRHLFGLAADIVVSGVKPSAVADYAERIGAGGVGRYNSFVHVDVSDVRRWRG